MPCLICPCSSKAAATGPNPAPRTIYVAKTDAKQHLNSSTESVSAEKASKEAAILATGQSAVASAPPHQRMDMTSPAPDNKLRLAPPAPPLSINQHSPTLTAGHLTPHAVAHASGMTLAPKSSSPASVQHTAAAAVFSPLMLLPARVSDGQFPPPLVLLPARVPDGQLPPPLTLPPQQMPSAKSCPIANEAKQSKEEAATRLVLFSFKKHTVVAPAPATATPDTGIFSSKGLDPTDNYDTPPVPPIPNFSKALNLPPTPSSSTLRRQLDKR